MDVLGISSFGHRECENVIESCFRRGPHMAQFVAYLPLKTPINKQSSSWGPFGRSTRVLQRKY